MTTTFMQRVEARREREERWARMVGETQKTLDILSAAQDWGQLHEAAGSALRVSSAMSDPYRAEMQQVVDGALRQAPPFIARHR